VKAPATTTANDCWAAEFKSKQTFMQISCQRAENSLLLSGRKVFALLRE
jgi:hypothetical protein